MKSIIDKYIIKENGIYRIECNQREYKEIKEKVLLLKNRFNRNFTIDDFVLVRIVKENFIPKNMEYYPLNSNNAYHLIQNPYSSIIGWIGYKIEEYKDIDIGVNLTKKDIKGNKLVSYYYRDTKHFSINSLASNVSNVFLETKFDDGDFIIIEPLKNNINNPRLKVLNPVDTFFNLHESSLKINENATILIKEELYNKLDKDLIKSFYPRKVFTFSCEPIIATDIVLLYLGIIPQNTKFQSMIKSESSYIDGKIYDDINYINNNKKYIEYLNNKYLDSSYLNIPSDMKAKRNTTEKDLEGTFHSETRYYEDEVNKCAQYEFDTYKEYLKMISKNTNKINNNILNNILNKIKEDIDDKKGTFFLQTFYNLYDEFEKVLLDSLLDMGYIKFSSLTQDFNKQKLLTLDKNRIG